MNLFQTFHRSAISFLHVSNLLDLFSFSICLKSCWQLFCAVGIVLFFIVEKIVRYVEDNSQKGAHSMGHGHHHYHHKRHDSSDKTKLNHQKNDDDGKETNQTDEEPLVDGTTAKVTTIRKVHLISKQ
jgi:hypothetical protein